MRVNYPSSIFLQPGLRLARKTRRVKPRAVVLGGYAAQFQTFFC